MWASSSSKDKDNKHQLQEKIKQVDLLNEVILLNSKQVMTQKTLIDELKNQLEYEKTLSNSLLEKNAKLQEESALLISQLDDYKIQYDNLRIKYNKLYHDYKNVVNQNILQINLDNSIAISNDNQLNDLKNNDENQSVKKVRSNSLHKMDDLKINSSDASALKKKTNFQERAHRSNSMLNIPDLGLIITNSPMISKNSIRKDSDKDNITNNNKPPHLSHFGHGHDSRNKSDKQIESIEDIDKEGVSKDISILTISDVNKSQNENNSSELKDLSSSFRNKKPNLHIFTKSVAAVDSYLERRKTVQYFEDLGNSVVALKYESVLSPLDNMEAGKKTNLMKKSNFLIPKKDVGTPINFIPMISPHLKNIPSKFQKDHDHKTHYDTTINSIPKKIKEVDEEDLVGSKNNENTENSMEIKTMKSIFEEFLVMGIDKKEFIGVYNNEYSEGFTPAKIIYHFENIAKANDDCPRKRIIHEFAFPYGAPFKRIKVSNSFGVLNEVAFSYNPNDNHKRAFIFTMRSDEYYDKFHRNDPFLNALNPDRILYCICIIKKDYLETTPENHVFTRKNRRNRKFFITKKIYCFVTYFPFFKLFIELLEDILNKIKFKRLEKYTLNRTEEHEILSKIDLSIVKDILDLEVTEFLRKIQETPLPEYGKKYEINGLIREKIIYELPTTDSAEYEECKWGAALTFSNFSLDDFLLVFFSILLEKKIIFVSKNIALLTASIQTFFSLIRPFTWPHPLIFNLPESLFPLLDSPVPFIFGINQSSNFLFQHNLKLSENNDILFICLDENRIFYSEKKLKKLLKIQPNFHNLKFQLQELYEYFNKNPECMIDFGSFRSPTLRKMIDHRIISKNLIYSPNKEEEIKCQNIFQIFRKALEEFIVKLLPKQPFFLTNENSILDMDKIIEEVLKNVRNTIDMIFLRKFFRTQLFSFWMEKFYGL